MGSHDALLDDILELVISESALAAQLRRACDGGASSPSPVSPSTADGLSSPALILQPREPERELQMFDV